MGSIPSLSTLIDSNVPPAVRAWRDVSFAELRAAVAAHFYAADVIRALGFPVGGNGYRALQLRIRRLKLDTNHWRGTKPYVPKPLAAVLTKGGYTNRTRLKQRLLAAGMLDNVCALCGMGPEWQGQPLVLVLDHVNGVADDYAAENLRLLCPNCNSQQPTFAGRNMKQRCRRATRNAARLNEQLSK